MLVLWMQTTYRQYQLTLATRLMRVASSFKKVILHTFNANIVKGDYDMYIILKTIGNETRIYDSAETLEKARDAINWDDDFSSYNAELVGDMTFECQTIKGLISWRIVDMNSDKLSQKSETHNSDLAEVETPLGIVSAKIKSNSDGSANAEMLISKDEKSFSLSKIIVYPDDIVLSCLDKSIDVPELKNTVAELKKISLGANDIYDVYAYIAPASVYGVWKIYLTTVDFTWWTCTESSKERQMLCVRDDADKPIVTDEFDNKSYCIRPVICFRCNKEKRFECGDSITVNNHPFTVVSINEDVISALSDVSVAKIPYGNNHIYKESVPKLVVDGWLFNLTQGQNLAVDRT